jgi:hypothetical protein
LALRLETFLHLPSQDVSLKEAWPANLELALNLWLCADGIDIVAGVEVAFVDPTPPAPFIPTMAARFAAAWMDDGTAKQFMRAYTQTYQDVSVLSVFAIIRYLELFS